MAKYLKRVRKVIKNFTKIKIKRVPRLDNSRADDLPRLASAIRTESRRFVLVEILRGPTIKEEDMELEF